MGQRVLAAYDKHSSLNEHSKAKFVEDLQKWGCKANATINNIYYTVVVGVKTIMLIPQDNQNRPIYSLLLSTSTSY